MRASFGALGADANSDNAGLGGGGLVIRRPPNPSGGQQAELPTTAGWCAPHPGKAAA